VANDVDRDLGHLHWFRFGSGEGKADVGEGLASLDDHIASSDKVALSVIGYLSSDEHQGGGRQR
jgi:hypothetical protein